MGTLVVILLCVMAPIGYLEALTAQHRTYGSDSLPLSFPAWCLYHPNVLWTGDVLDEYNTDGAVSSKIITGIRGYNWIYAGFTMEVIIFVFSTRVAFLYSESISHTIFQLPKSEPWKWIEQALEKLKHASDMPVQG